MYTYDESLRDFYSKVWGILVKHAGASTLPDDRESFVLSMTQIEYPTSEYRFQGLLGFGGKLYRNTTVGGLRIGCYPEDNTLARSAIISRVNNMLAALFATS